MRIDFQQLNYESSWPLFDKLQRFCRNSNANGASHGQSGGPIRGGQVLLQVGKIERHESAACREMFPTCGATRRPEFPGSNTQINSWHCTRSQILGGGFSDLGTSAFYWCLLVGDAIVSPLGISGAPFANMRAVMFRSVGMPASFLEPLGRRRISAMFKPWPTQTGHLPAQKRQKTKHTSPLSRVGRCSSSTKGGFKGKVFGWSPPKKKGVHNSLLPA